MELIGAVAQTLYEQATERNCNRPPWSSLTDRQRSVWIRDALAVFETVTASGAAVVRAYDVESLCLYARNPSDLTATPQDVLDKIENLKSMRPRVAL